MHAPTRYRLNTPHVVAEAIEADDPVQSEAIIVNLDSGTYYSITGAGILLWSAIVAGASLDELADAVAAASGESGEAAARAVAGFRDVLVENALIVERSDPPASPAALDLSRGGAGLMAPKVAFYTDMQDLILLDPVHEVDDQGWPHVQPVA